MTKSKAISSVKNAINKLHIQSDLHLIYQKNFDYDKQDEIDTLFDEYYVPLLYDLDHPALIEEWKKC